MSRRKIKAGSTSVSVPIFVQDTSSTTGAGLGSLVYNTSGLVAKYRREGEASWTTITLASATVGTWTSGGFVADWRTGDYEVGIPNAALASGAKWAVVQYVGVANMLDVKIEFELDAVDYQNGNSFGLAYLTGDIYAYLTTNLGLLGANLTALPALVWASATRLLTAGTNIVLAKGTGITGFNDLSSSQVTSAVDASTTASDAASAATHAYSAAGQTTGASIRSAVGLGAADLDTQLNSIYGVAGDTKSQTDKLQFDGSNYVKSSPQSDPPGIAGIPAAVRDIDNTSPADNSFGADVKSIKINGVPVTSTNSLVQTQISSAVWAKDTSTITTSGSIGKRLLDLFSGVTSLAQWLGMLAGKQTGDSTALAEIRATGVGSGGFTPVTDSLEAHRDVLGTPVDTDLSTDIANVAADVLALDVGAGSGVHHVTITFTSGGNPFEGATVTTLLGGVLKANALSGSDGVADNYLNDGTYTLNYAAEGHLGGTTTFTVSADGDNKDIALTLLSITPSDPGFSTGYLVAYTDGVATENVKHTRKLLKLPSGSTGLSLNAGEKTAYSNSSGIVQFTNHIPGATYEVRREDVQGGGFHYVAGETDGFEIISCYG